MINTSLNISPINTKTMLGICATPIVALYMPSTCVLHYEVQYHMLCYTLYSQRDPYTPLHQTGCTPVHKTATKHTKIFPHPWGPGCAPGYTQGIADRTVGGLAIC